MEKIKNILPLTEKVKNIDKNEFKELVKEYLRYNKEELLIEIQKYLQNKDNAEDFAFNADNYAFYIISKKLKLNNLKRLREKRNEEILNKYALHNPLMVKVAFCYKYFKDNSNNVNLTISSILDRIKFSDTYKKFCSGCEKILKNLKKYLDTNSFSYLLKLNNAFNNFDINKIIIKLTNEANNQFYNELKYSLSKDFLKNIKPELLYSKNGEKVEFYTIEKQTQSQQTFNILFKTIDYQDCFYTNNATQCYLEREKVAKYSSFSLINQTNKLNGLGIYRRIILGFNNLGKSNIISCNTHDGYVNQATIEKNKFVRKQQYLPIDKFLKQTGVYNEIVFTNSHTIKPSFILSLSNEPNENLIEVASGFNLPIVYINTAVYRYKKTNDDKKQDFYKYQAFFKY